MSTASYVRRLDVMLTLLMRFHVRHRQPLLSSFLSGLGVRHDGGLIVEEVEIEPSAAQREAARLLDSWSLRDVLVYLVMLRYQSSWLVPEWEHWLPELVDRRGVSETIATSEELEGPAAGDAEADPEDTHEFTTLDQQLVRVIVDVAQGVTGALEPDAVMDLVEELIELRRLRDSTPDVRFRGPPPPRQASSGRRISGRSGRTPAPPTPQSEVLGFHHAPGGVTPRLSNSTIRSPLRAAAAAEIISGSSRAAAARAAMVQPVAPVRPKSSGNRSSASNVTARLRLSSNSTANRRTNSPW